jgi:hypothetical protein
MLLTQDQYNEDSRQWGGAAVVSDLHKKHFGTSYDDSVTTVFPIHTM